MSGGEFDGLGCRMQGIWRWCNGGVSLDESGAGGEGGHSGGAVTAKGLKAWSISLSE